MEIHPVKMLPGSPTNTLSLEFCKPVLDFQNPEKVDLGISAEWFSQYPVTSGITPEGLQGSGLLGSVLLLSCRLHEGLDSLGKAHHSQESMALTTRWDATLVAAASSAHGWRATCEPFLCGRNGRGCLWPAEAQLRRPCSQRNPGDFRGRQQDAGTLLEPPQLGTASFFFF